MSAWTAMQTAETKTIEDALAGHFPDVKVYRYNPASIRVRIIDERFRGRSKPERERMVLPLVRALPEDIQSDITILLLLAPEEAGQSLMNREFEDPSRPRL